MKAGERRLLIGLLAALAASGALLYLHNPAHLALICREDGFVEYSQAFLYFFAALLFARAGAQKGLRGLAYWGYASLFFLLGAEEVSWGQRIFNLVTPAQLEAVNVQRETNLHNIDGLHRRVRMMGLLVCLAICYAIPLTDRFVPALRRLYQRFDMPIFPLWTWPLPAIGFAFMVVPRLFGRIVFDLDELGELYLAVSFFGFGLAAYRAAGAAPGAGAQQPASAATIARAA